MPLKVTVDHPEAGDQDIYIHGLGSFRNGTTTEVDDEQVMRFRAITATQEQTHNEDGSLSVQSVLGPEPHTLEMRGFTFEQVGEDKDDLDTSTQAQMVQDQQEAGDA